MIQAIDLRPDELALTQSILRQFLPPDAEVFVFGSRVLGKARRGSDLDLAIHHNHPLPPALLSTLRAAFEDSDLAFEVDVIEWLATSKNFQRAVAPSLRPLPL